MKLLRTTALTAALMTAAMALRWQLTVAYSV
jgi:hypothetical protein